MSLKQKQSILGFMGLSSIKIPKYLGFSEENQIFKQSRPSESFLAFFHPRELRFGPSISASISHQNRSRALPKPSAAAWKAVEALIRFSPARAWGKKAVCALQDEV
jgi:hypothetical protein